MLLRWKLVYQSGIVRVGHWSRDVDRDQAWLKSKEGLAHAFIESKHEDKIIIMAGVKGEDFCNFEWIQTVTYRGPQRYRPTIIGINLVCRDTVLSVYANGHAEKNQKRLPDNLFRYGKI